MFLTINGTDVALGTVRIVNETNITIEVSKILVESQNTTNIEYLSYIVPLLAILATAAMAFLSIRANSRNIFIQMNQDEIVKNIKELTHKIQSGDKENILKFLDSENGIYIPTSLKKNIKKILNSTHENDLDLKHIEHLKKVVTDCITKQHVLF